MRKPLVVRDIMTTAVLTVTPKTHVCEAIHLLVDHHITGLPVIDAERYIQGIISEEDLIHLLLEELITETRSVKDFMKKNPLTCSPEDSVVKACEIFLENPSVNLPVVKDNKLVGIISRSDILRLIPPKREKK